MFVTLRADALVFISFFCCGAYAGPVPHLCFGLIDCLQGVEAYSGRSLVFVALLSFLFLFMDMQLVRRRCITVEYCTC